MASTRLDQNGDCSDNTHVQKLLPPDCDDFGEARISPRIPSDSHDAVNTFGEPEIMPRIGDEYQAELPELTRESNIVSPSRKSTGAETSADIDLKFLVGLPIKLTWISSEERDILGFCSSSTRSSDFTSSDSKNLNKMEISFSELEPSHDSRRSMEELQNLPSGADYRLAPGLCDEYWNAAEKDCFLLGLYIFQKNFVQVRRFVGTKEMGALLSYYYGKFYCSPEYRRWSECRKMKSKKGIFGQRIFSGLRQQELLSRILARVSEECQMALFEVSKTFGDEKISLADYVFSLKAMVGTNILVEAVGIGKGKQDLTGMALEPSRSHQVIHMRPEIPTGKACSSLTSAEIIKFLSGDYRLSKNRSNDLFWEAVWPRLLARGWHSEQPKDQGGVGGSKHCLVFLVPGVKKFSRRKLVKGDHYFDSVTDVLTKVAQDPGLIELGEVDGSKRKEEYEWSGDRKSKENDNDPSTSNRHCYLQPRTANQSTVVMKFTVVDTSLSDGKVRELRSLPSKISDTYITPNHTDDTDEDIPEDESDNANAIALDALTINASLKTTKSEEKKLPGKKDSSVIAMHQDGHTAYPHISATLIPEKNKKDLQENTRSRKVPKSLLSQTLEKEHAGCIAPVTKRSRILTPCNQEETQASLLSSSIPLRLEDGPSSCRSGTSEVTENLLSQVSMCLDKYPSTSSSRGSPRESNEKPRTRMLFDLNLPQVPPDSEDGSFPSGLSNEQDITSNKLDDHSVPQSDIQATSMEQSNLNPRRHSTRIRPPTTRALVAVAEGYLTVNRRRKRKETNSHESQSSRPSQRACGVVKPNDSTDSIPASQMEAAENGASSSGNSNILMNPQLPPLADEDSASGQ